MERLEELIASNSSRKDHGNGSLITGKSQPVNSETRYDRSWCTRHGRPSCTRRYYSRSPAPREPRPEWSSDPGKTTIKLSLSLSLSLPVLQIQPCATLGSSNREILVASRILIAGGSRARRAHTGIIRGGGRCLFDLPRTDLHGSGLQYRRREPTSRLRIARRCTPTSGIGFCERFGFSFPPVADRSTRLFFSTERLPAVIPSGRQMTAGALASFQFVSLSLSLPLSLFSLARIFFSSFVCMQSRPCNRRTRR